jgi:hypothetical protein
MRKKIYLIVFVLSCFFASACTSNGKNVNDTLQQIQHSAGKSDIVDTLTLAGNTINNILTWSAVMLAVLTLIVALFEILGYLRNQNEIKRNEKIVDKKIIEINETINHKVIEINDALGNNIKSNDKIITDKIQAINAKEQELNDCILQSKAISERLSGQEKYVNKTNQYLYEALDKIANQIPDANIAKVIMKEMLHNYQVTNLYSSTDSKFATLAYLQQNGTMNDIEHLEYVSYYDSNELNKEWAREIIGIIKHRDAE